MAVKFDKYGDHTKKPFIGTLQRGKAYPLDDTDIWLETDDEEKLILKELEEYAKNKNGQSYVGQRLTYITVSGEVSHYTIIDEEGTLKMDIKCVYDADTQTLRIYT